MFSISTAEQTIKANWIPGRDFQISSIQPTYFGETKLSVWHALKPNI